MSTQILPESPVSDYLRGCQDGAQLEARLRTVERLNMEARIAELEAENANLRTRAENLAVRVKRLSGQAQWHYNERRNAEGT